MSDGDRVHAPTTCPTRLCKSLDLAPNGQRTPDTHLWRLDRLSPNPPAITTNGRHHHQHPAPPRRPAQPPLPTPTSNFHDYTDPTRRDPHRQLHLKTGRWQHHKEFADQTSHPYDRKQLPHPLPKLQPKFTSHIYNTSYFKLCNLNLDRPARARPTSRTS